MNVLERRREPLERTFFAEHGDNVVDAWTHGRSRERDANRLGEFAHRYALLLERRGEFLFDAGYVEVV